MIIRNHISTSISRILTIALLLHINICSHAQGRKKVMFVEEDTIPFYRGMSVSFDLVGLAQLTFGDYGQYEGGLRINLKDKYYPVIELGLGKANATDEATEITFKTSAPYGRIGCDFNLMKNKHDIHRVYGGLRYGFTSYKFDVFTPGILDPVWKTQSEYQARDIKANYHWLEFVVGVDAKIWKCFRMGWTARYKRRITHNDGDIGNTWYVPGYGRQGNLRLGGTFNITVEL